jgi:hypothetical protein
MWFGGHIMPMALKSSIRHWNNTAVTGDKNQKWEVIQLTMAKSYLDAPKSAIPHKYTSISSMYHEGHTKQLMKGYRNKKHISVMIYVYVGQNYYCSTDPVYNKSA